MTAACVAAALVLHGPAFACDTPARTIELAPGQNVGGVEAGFSASGLRAKEVILTFDDGPDPALTPRILDTLRAACVPATFFVLGGPARENASLVKRQLAEGHSVGGHTLDHVDLSSVPFNEATRDITQGFLPVTASGGDAQLFRFPKLLSTPALLVWLREHGMSAVGADIDPADWAGDPPQKTLQRLQSQIREKGRGIILLHDSEENTAKLLPGLLAFLRSEGYSVVHLAGVAPQRQLASGESR